MERCKQSGKHIHFSMGEAEAHVRSIKDRVNKYYEGVPYNCKYCGFFHVGRRKKKESKNKYSKWN